MSTPIRSRRAVRLLLHSTLAVATTLSMLAITAVSTAPMAAAVVPPVAPADNAHVTADPLPTVQVDGVVWDQEIIGNIVYVGGDFDNARPAGSPQGSNQTARSNMLAYNLTTGALIPGFVANTNSQVKSIVASPDGSRIYIAGQFTSVNGVSKLRIAALNPTTGAVITAFNPGTDYIVNDLAVTGTTVYAGGAFNAAKGQTRTKLAAFSAANGDLLPWAPVADANVETMLLSPDGSKVLAGGHFFNINGSSAYGMGAIDPATGDLIPWAANQVIRDGGPDGAILDLTTDGTYIYGNGYTFGRAAGNLEGVFKANATTGEIVWIDDCHGDTYSNFPRNGYVHKAGHFHFCGNIGGTTQSDDTITQWGEHMHHAMSLKDEVAGTIRRDQWGYHNLEGRPAPSVVAWAPDWQIGTFTGQSQATWDVDGNSQYVVYGGEFTRVNSLNQQGLVRFAVSSIAPDSEGPRLSGTSFPINVVSESTGRVRVSLAANIDRDDKDLTYQLQRNGVTVQTTTAASTYWDQSTVSFFETGLTPGQSYSYRVRASDNDGNAQFSSTVPVVVASSGSPKAYADKVIADDARIYWRLGDAPGSSTATDAATTQTGAVNEFTFGRPGAIIGDPNTAASPDSTSGRVVQPALVNKQGLEERNSVVDELSVEAWFRTTSGQGGRLLGFGSSQTGSSGSSSHDRMLYVSNSGRVLFGVRTRPEGTGSTGTRVRRTIESGTGLNDGSWHHVVGTLSTDGMKLYVDGELVSSRADTNSGHGYYGYWRVGADSVNSGWTSAPTSTRLDGDIDEAAVYYKALSAAQVSSHWVLSGRAGNQAPTADFSWTANGLTASFDGTASSDADGSVSSYAWNFGDGTTGTGPTPQHTYATAGTRTVTLTVTDNGGSTGVTSQSVTVNAPTPNDPPTAAFTFTTNGLGVNVDSSTSTDSDGTIVSRTWTFGDGGTGSGTTSSHTYASANTYTVTLTVTDDDGDTDSVSQQVTVTAPPANQPPTAEFTFGTTDLRVDVDSATSADSDGTIVSRTWDFGDGGVGSGTTANHTYAAAGDYTVTLTVTDDDGAPDSESNVVTVTEPGPIQVFAADAFGRTTASSWGTADVGGAWTVAGTASRYTVNGGTGNQTMAAAGQTTSAYLPNAGGGDVSAIVDVSFDKAPTGSGIYSSLALRRSGTSDYRARVRAMPASTTLTIFRVVNGVETSIAAANVPGLVYNVGDVLRIQFEAEGSSPTTLSAKVWKLGQAEPATFQVTTTDSTAAMQVPGGVGLVSYLSSSSTNAPVTARYDNLQAATPGAPPDPGNDPPVAAFSVTPTGLDVAVNGSASTDDGSIVSYAWTFGDGGTGSGVTTGHTYALAGTYTVTLTVTDDDGATDLDTQQVTVSSPGGEVEVALDDFNRSAANGWGSATNGGAWTVTGTAASYSVNGTAGRIQPGVGQNRSATLGSVSAADVESLIDYTLESAPTGGGIFVSSVLRKVGTTEYRLRVRMQPAAAALQLMRVVNGTETVIGTQTLPAPISAGSVVHLRFRATGAGTTTLSGKVWVDAASEPANWTIQMTDSTAALQGAGAVGVHTYLSGTASAPLAVLVDRLRAILA